jgi:hypothetical protein
MPNDMDGYDFITAVDDKRWGTVVGREGEYVIVEHGALRKHRYAVPESAVDVDEQAQEVRTTLSGELISESPKVDGDFDSEAVARHYGLDDADGPSPAESSGGDTAVEERAQIREGSAESTDGMPDESPALLGDRLTDVREDQKP